MEEGWEQIKTEWEQVWREWYTLDTSLNESIVLKIVYIQLKSDQQKVGVSFNYFSCDWKHEGCKYGAC